MCVCVIIPVFHTQSILKHWKLKGEIEKLIWNHFQPDLLLVHEYIIPLLAHNMYYPLLENNL